MSNREIETYSQKKMATIRRMFGDELTYRTYKELRDMGIARVNICQIYNINKNSLHAWLTLHESSMKKVN